jgi:choline dehydrogenase-like flavoprotein
VRCFCSKPARLREPFLGPSLLPIERAETMFIDARTLADGAVVEADLCIVGAGAAGISIGLQFLHGPFRVCLLEAGGTKFDSATQSLYKGTNVGLPYPPLEQTRFRYFGGSTNIEGWGGWCKPFDAFDLRRREWVPYSGWPIDRDELDPYYARAHEILGLGPFDYNLDHWLEKLGPSLGLLNFACGTVETELSQISCVRFGRDFRRELADSTNVRVYLHANAVEIETTVPPDKVTAVHAKTLTGRRLRVAARAFVLATGGIENARLLLLSNRVEPKGLGNGHDLVGRFFMDHPRLRLGDVVFSDRKTQAEFYDHHDRMRRRVRSIRGVYHRSLIAGALSIPDEVQRREQLLDYRAWIWAVYPGDESEGMESLRWMYWQAREGGLPRGSVKHLSNIRGDLRNVCAALYSRARGRAAAYKLENILEPDPNPDSRVTLGPERDDLGLPRVRVDWRLGPMVKRTLRRAHEIIGEELAKSGLGRLENPFSEDDDERWVSSLQCAWHHMGTTRMHEDPRRGVVDRNCKVHGIANLFIAGSSVFPTAGNDMPTLTIVALALRLADEVKRSFARS